MLKNPSLQQLALFKSAAIIFAVIAIYLQDLSLVFANALHYEGYSYILLIPALIIYLLYRKRRMLAAAVTTYDSITVYFRITNILTAAISHDFTAIVYSWTYSHFVQLNNFASCNSANHFSGISYSTSNGNSQYCWLFTECWKH
jgi:hypothetical protein